MRYVALIFIIAVVALFAVSACVKKEVIPIDMVLTNGTGNTSGNQNNAQVPATIDNQDTGVVPDNSDISIGDII